MVGQLLWRNLNVIDDYFPGIMTVVYSNTSPEDAIQQIENVDDDIEKDTDNN